MKTLPPRSTLLVAVALIAIVVAGLAAAPAEAHSRHHRHRVGIGFYSSYYWGWGPYFRRPYLYGPPVIVVDGAERAGAAKHGAIDLDVKPKKAEVWIDGAFAGTTASFDGHPSYLWLEEGSYRIEIRLDGYRSWSDEVKVTPGATIRLKFKLVEGESAPPGDG